MRHVVNITKENDARKWNQERNEEQILSMLEMIEMEDQ